LEVIEPNGELKMKAVVFHGVGLEPMLSVIEAYEAFDPRQPGWLKVELKPAAA
jgi:threonine dehydrogenase-like Zn-dependent dehydrogenase